MSEEHLISAPNVQPGISGRSSGGSSNKKPLLVAGLTLLATLLIAGQAFTAYSVYMHSEKLSLLERRSDRLQEMTARASANRTPMKMAAPMSSFRIMAAVSDDKVESAPPPPSKTNRTPMKMAAPMSSLSMMAAASDEKVESTPPPTASLTKCQLEAAGLLQVSLPSFKPKCDAVGDYEAEQCWQDMCWCVDKNGAAVADSVLEGHAQCQA